MKKVNYKWKEVFRGDEIRYHGWDIYFIVVKDSDDIITVDHDTGEIRSNNAEKYGYLGDLKRIDLRALKHFVQKFATTHFPKCKECDNTSQEYNELCKECETNDSTE